MDFSFLSQPAFSGGGVYLDWVISGIKWTLLVSVLGWIIAFSVGSVLGVLRTTPLAWLRFEGVPTELRLTLWPGGDDSVLAATDPHATRITWREGGAS